MKISAILLIPETSFIFIENEMKFFLKKNYPRIIFELRPDASVTEPTLESLEAKEGAFGSIEGNSNLAAQAQMSGIQDEISFEYNRLLGR